MVGDSPYDAEGAERCGCDFAAVTFGFGFRSRAQAEAVKHVFIADSNDRLCEFILKTKREGDGPGRPPLLVMSYFTMAENRFARPLMS